jgi:S1-C subfamily serine protease
MKKLLRLSFVLLCVFSNIFAFSQQFNEYKYVLLESNDYGRDIMSTAKNIFSSKNFYVLTKDQSFPEDAVKDPCIVLRGVINFRRGKTGFTASVLDLSLKDCSGKKLYSSKAKNTTQYGQPHVLRCFEKATNGIYDHIYSGDTYVIEEPIFRQGLDIKSEYSVKEYFDKNGSEGIEGIWQLTSSDSKSIEKYTIFKNKDEYHMRILKSGGIWFPGDLKAVIETSASDDIFTLHWNMSSKKTMQSFVGVLKNKTAISFDNESAVLYKTYPKNTTNSDKNNSSEWKSNGSGLILSKSGHIVTNYHVIENANDIEIEILIDQEISKLNAEVIQSDKVNDLAIIKVVDVNFDGFDNLNYNFKTLSSDVGTKVYAYGYPLALSVMGREIKVTDGMINSKTGYDGDITTYQISAPIQGGNSGGPLFDDNGNLLGINSSGLNKNVVDNVGYSIKTSYIANLIDVLPRPIELPSSTKLKGMTLTEQIKEISKLVVLIKVK